MSHDYLNASISATASQLPAKRLERAKTEFAKMDLNQDGKIELEEFLAYTLAKEVKRLLAKFQATDEDKDGAVDFEEFLLVTDSHYAFFKQFAEFDVEGNGHLTLDEAVAILDKFVIPLDRPVLEAKLQHLGRDSTGTFSYEEFLGIVVHHGMQ